MGKTYSKQEEIIIAQNGANQVDLTNVKSHMKMVGVAIIILGILLLGVIMCKCCGRLKLSATGWMHKTMGSSIQKFHENQSANNV